MRCEPTAEYAATLPVSTLACLPGAGHLAMLDRPGVYHHVVGAFLRDDPLPSTKTGAGRGPVSSLRIAGEGAGLPVKCSHRATAVA